MDLLLLAVFICSILYTQGYEVLDEGSDASEQDCLDLLTSDSFDASELKAKYIGYAMKRGFWKCAKELSHVANSARIDVRSVFDMESRVIAKEIKEIKSAIESSLPVSMISPAFQWAQSPTEIFLNVKFAHKLDAPATLNVEADSVNITDDYLYLNATDGRKIFTLNLDLLRNVNPSESSWSMASVGRMTITLSKRTGPDNWPRLTKSKKKPNNIHFWWELHEKHAKALEALDDDDDESKGDPVVKPPAKAGVENPPSTSELNEKNVSDNSSELTNVTTNDARDNDEGAPTKKKKKKKVKKEKKTKRPSLDDLIKDIEKAGKERKKDVDRKAKVEKEAINKEIEEEIKNMKREYYKSSKDDAKDNVAPPKPTNLEKFLPDEDASENAVEDTVAEAKEDL